MLKLAYFTQTSTHKIATHITLIAVINLKDFGLDREPGFVIIRVQTNINSNVLQFFLFKRYQLKFRLQLTIIHIHEHLIRSYRV